MRVRLERLVWSAPAALFVLLAAALGLGGWGGGASLLGEPFAAAALLAATVAAALHRPSRIGALGLGTLALPPAFVWLGVLPAALVAVAASVVAEALRRALERQREAPLPERRHLSRVVAQASLVGLGALAARGVWAWLDGSVVAGEARGLALAATLAALAFLSPLVLFEIATRRLLREEGAGELGWALVPLAWELPGFAIGALAVAVGRHAGWLLGGGVLAAAALLAFEAARQELRAAAAGRSLEAAEKVSRAGASLATGGSQLGRLARRIFEESARILPYSYALLRLASPDAGVASFWCDESAEPQPGEPDPPPYPPALPGFHRREPWKRFERVLLAEEDRRAELVLWCDPRRLEPGDEVSLASLVPQVAASVRSALLDREATVDRLTGTGTRRALERRLADAFESASAEGHPLALVIADLDHFKRINDTFGHAVGDRALVAVAGALSAPNRQGDFCGRFGGEEFVLVFERTSAAAALEIAERLRRRIEELALESDGQRIQLSMSFGVAAYPDLAVRTAEELLELADGALYTAKRLGRNLALLDLGGGRMQTAAGELLEVAEPPPPRTPVFFA